jgi:hypothetical protein
VPEQQPLAVFAIDGPQTDLRQVDMSHGVDLVEVKISSEDSGQRRRM